MPGSDTRVLIVGCGIAGATAAIGLARRGIPVTVLEGGVYPGAENWSGGVLFGENLVRPEILGPRGLGGAAVERPIVQRGIMMTDGDVAGGWSLRSPEAFAHCYSVLRPVFDHDLAQKARGLGAEILCGTTALALLRDGERICGVLTDRGPITADVVFLAEGDASNLVGREGLETLAAGRDGLQRPEFLQGVKEVLELPAGVIEERFGVKPGEGAAYEFLLRNPLLDGKPLRLNAGAFLYTNRESLSLGFVAPLTNLAAFRGRHNQLMEWLKAMPALAPLLADAKVVSFGAKLIRGGGFKEMPRLVVDGLAVGGAASGIGVDFPCPNYTGPASYMGWAFSEAVNEILNDGARFDRDALEAHYRRRVMESSYVADVEQLREWPHFVSGNREFFGAQVEAVAGTLHILGGEGSALRRRLRASRWFYENARPATLRELAADGRASMRGLQATAGLWKQLPALLLFWVVNCVIGFFPRRTKVAGELLPEVFAERKLRLGSWYLRWTLWRFRPGVLEALWYLYANDRMPLREKMTRMRWAVLSRLALWDFLFLPAAVGSSYVLGALQAGWTRFRTSRGKLDFEALANQPFGRRRAARRARRELNAIPESVSHDEKLSLIAYESDPATHIHFHAAHDKRGLPANGGAPAFSVCPAKVYQEEVDLSRGTSVAVLHENCVRCETCWRADDAHVDWGRTRGHRLVFETYSSVDSLLLAHREIVERKDEAATAEESDASQEAKRWALDDQQRARLEERALATKREGEAFRTLFVSLPSVLSGADQALIKDAGHALMKSVSALASAVRDRDSGFADTLDAFVALAEPRLDQNRFFHFDADVALLLRWHLPRLEERSDLCLELEDEVRGTLEERLRNLVDELFGKDEIEASEEALAPVEAARSGILRLAAGLVRNDQWRPRRPGSPARDLTIEALARVSPSLAVVLTQHLAALDLVPEAEGPWSLLRNQALCGKLLLGVADADFAFEDSAVSGTLEGGLLGGVDVLFCVGDARLAAIDLRVEDESVQRRIHGGIGLRGAGPGALRLDQAKPIADEEESSARGALRTRSAWDLVALSRGMASYLEERALDHAGSRVQFPGLFRDLRGRDGIAKFGAVQAMLAGIAQGRAVLEALRGQTGHGLRAATLATEWLGCSPRSIAYLSGQVLGGTAYSEEDPVCRFYRDASALSRLPWGSAEVFVREGTKILEAVAAKAPWPGLDLKPRPATTCSSPLWGEAAAALETERQALDAALHDAPESVRQAIALDLGRLGLQRSAALAVIDQAEELLRRGEVDSILVPVAQELCERVATRCHRLKGRLADVDSLVELGRFALRETAIEGHSGASGSGYDEYLKSEQRFGSGDLFLRPPRSSELAYTPELHEADEALRTLDRETTARFRERFAPEAREGKSYQREVEGLHHVPLEDVQWLLDQGYFRMVIPSSLGGEGLAKAHYYLCCTRMMREADPSQAFLVMGSTSIGTTPILIGYKEDLPAARKSLEAILGEPAPLDEVGAIIERCREGVLDPRRAEEIDEIVAGLPRRLGKILRGSKALSLALQGLQKALGGAARAVKKKDRTAIARGLESARAAMDGWRDRLQRELDTLPAREAAHEFYLRLIARGHISAFALTEPSAGSDTARVRTRAEVVEVPLKKDPRGFYIFTPHGGEGTRTLFPDASFRFDDGRMLFVGDDGREHEVQVRDFAFERDEEPYRHVEIDGERITIDDIGAVTSKERGPRYRYWQVDGAKMWITNGSVAGVMILYARTARGLSGFMLDGHAEGLVVGKDEEKMGQRGCGTNELSLNAVRIPEAQVIGIEGRGQENALETLNVGRSGLGICISSLMQGAVEDVRRWASGRELEPTQLYELGRMVVDTLLSESLAWQLVGRFDHPGTRSVRIESAQAKAFASEAYHRVLTRAERILGPEGVLDSNCFEKRRRDARVLTIYEGTNEIQRFLIARDLLDVLDVEQRRDGGEEGEGHGVTSARSGLDRGRGALLEQLAALREELGSRGWQIAQLQPRVFELVDGVTRGAALSALVHRLALAERLLSPVEGGLRIECLRRAAEAAAREFPRYAEERVRKLEDAATRMRAGRDLATAEISDRVLLAHDLGEEEEASPLPSEYAGAGEIVVVLDPQPRLAPRPRVRGGAIHEHRVTISDSERAALREALAICAAGDCVLTVVAAGGMATADCLREALALGADRAMLLDIGERQLLASQIVEALATLIRTGEELTGRRSSLILGAQDQERLLLPLARRLEVPALGGVSSAALRGTEGERELSIRRAGKEVRLEEGAVLLIEDRCEPWRLPFTMDGWQAARHRPLSVVEFTPDELRDLRLSAPRRAGGESDVAPKAEGLAGVAKAFVEEAGLLGSGQAATYAGSIEEGNLGDVLDGVGALAVVAHEGGELNSAAGDALFLAQRLRRDGRAAVVLLSPGAEPAAEREALGALGELAPSCARTVLPLDEAGFRSPRSVAEALDELRRSYTGPLVLSPELREAGLSMACGCPVVDAVDTVEVEGETLVLEGKSAAGRLRFRIDGIAPDRLVTIATGGVEAPTTAAETAESLVLRLPRWSGSEVDPLVEILMDALSEVGAESIADAEFLIDVGYGVGSRDGIEEVIEPLRSALEELGVKGVKVGATRKVTQDLGILPEEVQIGQTGLTVEPRVLIAVGVSGAPQHMEYIGERAVIFAFNKDPEAAIMTLNRSKPRPRVFPIVGDLFVEVPRFVEALRSLVPA